MEIWDQTLNETPPTSGTFKEASFDSSGHGTAVASIIANCATGCSFLIIKLNTSTGNTTPTTISLLRAIDYSIKRAIELAMPLVINLSFGNNYGDHGSNSILEDYIDSVSGIYKLSIIVGSGNDGRAARHHQFMLGNLSWQKIDFVVNENQGGINLQIWRNYADYIDILMQTPSGKILGPFNMYEEIMTYNTEDMIIKVIYGYPSSINRNQETYISIIPRDTYIEAGIWNIFIKPKSISNGRVDIWLPVAGSTSADVRFLNPTEFTTLTIPSTARKVITVGAYNSRTLSYAAFSGRGYTINGDIKPDLSAPGVDIDVALPGGGYGTASGTSFATPFVSAAAAIMMEYGIVEGNDLFLYGEKLKAYLINGAKKLPGYKEWPNELLGWGALCLKDSLP